MPHPKALPILCSKGTSFLGTVQDTDRARVRWPWSVHLCGALPGCPWGWEEPDLGKPMVHLALSCAPAPGLGSSDGEPGDRDKDFGCI